MVADVERWREQRDRGAVVAARDQLCGAASGTENVMPATIALAAAGGTTGEWAATLRELWGEFRAPTGVAGASMAGVSRSEFDDAREKIRAFASRQGGPPRLLVAKPGLDGHSNGAEQIAVAARDAGFEVVYQGIRQTPEQIAAVARDEDVDVIGVSILSGSHMDLVADILQRLHQAGVEAPLVVGGIIPPEDAAKLAAGGVAAVYTPKDFQFGRIMSDLAELASRASGTST
jgi:(2R)-ethylmalonyl-CoA mutase